MGTGSQTEPSDMEFIDSHAHLDDHAFDADREAVIERAADASVAAIVTVAEDLGSARCAVELARRYPQVYAAVGVHPHRCADDSASVAEEIRRLAEERKVVAVGEIGLDYYRGRADRDRQQDTLRRYLALAAELDLPVIVHCREAFADLNAILDEHTGSRLRGVMHCFSGSVEEAKRQVDRGFHISFTGPLTFPNAERTREVGRSVPVERLLLETDAPLLSPQPVRGKRNEPAFLRYTAEKLAEIKGLSLDDIARITTRNARNLFDLPSDAARSAIAYRIRNSLYLNITNRCTNLCTFCRRLDDAVVKGHDLRLDHEPSAEEIIAAAGDPTAHDEIVFCGYGEPMVRLDVVRRVAQWLREHSACSIRMNTNGEANLFHGRNVVPDLEGLIDVYSVSLNAPNAEEYNRLCRPQLGPQSYEAVKEFIRLCRMAGHKVVATAVAVPGLDLDACRRVAEEELGVPLRVRPFNDVG